MSKKLSKAKIRAYRISFALVVFFIFSCLFVYIVAPAITRESYEGPTTIIATTTPPLNTPSINHVSAPDSIKGIYMTACTASVPKYRDALMGLIDDTELNSVVIDIKSYDGHISFMPKAENLKIAVGGCFVKDMQDFIKELHRHNIYVIGRIASFQDQLMVKLHPELAVKKASATTTVWKDFKGISWIDPSAKSHWEYLVALAKEAYNIGFDEINFDYIRFPADGNMTDIYYPLSGNDKKSDIIRSFSEYLHNNLSIYGIKISADIFGMTTTNPDDLSIGQILENFLPNFDYLDPMVYPSHYPNNFFHLGDPNQHVYEVVKISMDYAVRRTLATTTPIALPRARIGTSTPAIYSKPAFDIHKLRPWLQDNNYPVTYTPQMVKDEIQANHDAGLNSWMLWNASNKYTKSALVPVP